MKISAYYPAHYGKEYLEASLKSVVPHVDEVLILYTDNPSYGKFTNLKNPDSRDELMAIVEKECNSFKWVDIPATHQENQHRNMKSIYLHDSDIIVAVDADEIWDDLDLAIKAAWDSNYENINVSGSQWYHFWRSFNECHRDGFAPTRFHCKKGKQGTGLIDKGTVYHMGYAQSEAITEYKISCHGHKSISGSWYSEKWLNYKRGETTHLHPDSQTVWIETQNFDKTTMPSYLKDHPYYGLDKIV
jgi:hypothetical protein